MRRTTFDEYGQLFLKQGRGQFISKCVILCVIKFKCQNSGQRWRTSFVNFGYNREHAEEIAIRRIEEKEDAEQW
jgi:hypothetical protein